MNWLFGKKAEKGARKVARAALAVEGLEDRALMATFTLIDTLNARDTINIQELNVIQSIETFKLNETGNFQQVIANGQGRTQALTNLYKSVLAQQQIDSNAGNANAVAADQLFAKQILRSGQEVRSLMRQATVLDNTIQTTLSQGISKVTSTFNNTQKNLSHGHNPFLTVPHAVNALNFYGAQARQHFTTGSTQMRDINTQITGPLFLPQVV